MSEFRNGQLSIFRANKSKNGAASRFQLSKKPDGKVQCFLEMAKQVGELDANGNANFSWRGGKNATQNGSVTVKLGLADIGDMLAVISGRKNQVGQEGKNGLFHSNDKGSTTLDFKIYVKDGEPQCFALNSTSKVGTGEPTKVNHLMSWGEGEALRVFLQSALIHMNNWDLSQAFVKNDKPADDNPL